MKLAFKECVVLSVQVLVCVWVVRSVVYQHWTGGGCVLVCACLGGPLSLSMLPRRLCVGGWGGVGVGGLGGPLCPTFLTLTHAYPQVNWV